MNARIAFKQQVTAIQGLHPLIDWFYQMMWLVSGKPEDPDDDIILEKHSAEAAYSAV